MNNDYLIAFSNTHNTLKAKKFLTENYIEYELIATPREISKECGFCLLLHNLTINKMEDITRKLKSTGLSQMNVFKKGEKAYEKIY